MMKNKVKPFLLPALLAVVMLSACGKKAEERVPENVPVPAPAPEAPADVKPSPTNEPGGYVPTPEERVPGIARPTETAPTESAPASEAAPAPEAAPAN